MATPACWIRVAVASACSAVSVTRRIRAFVARATRKASPIYPAPGFGDLDADHAAGPARVVPVAEDRGVSLNAQQASHRRLDERPPSRISHRLRAAFPS